MHAGRRRAAAAARSNCGWRWAVIRDPRARLASYRECSITARPRSRLRRRSQEVQPERGAEDRIGVDAAVKDQRAVLLLCLHQLLRPLPVPRPLLVAGLQLKPPDLPAEFR